MCIYWIASHSGPHYINCHGQAKIYGSKTIETRQLTAKHELNKRQLETLAYQYQF